MLTSDNVVCIIGLVLIDGSIIHINIFSIESFRIGISSHDVILTMVSGVVHTVRRHSWDIFYKNVKKTGLLVLI